MLDQEMTDKKAPERSSTGFSVSFSGELTADTAEKLLESETCSLLLCHRGELTVTTLGQRHRLLRGTQAAIIAESSMTIATSEELKASAIIFKGELAVALLRYYLGGESIMVTDASPASSAKYSAFTASFSNATAQELSLLEAHMLICGILTERSGSSAHGEPAASAIRRYIDMNADRKLSLDELSHHFFISRTQLYRMFTSEYGISPIKYALSQRIERSKLMLADDSLRIADIADALCFTDAKHFTKTFRAFVGTSPSEYRRSRGNSPKN